MFIDSLKINNFRNYEEADVSFSDGINILYGDNAQGKTNILEAIYMVATTKSHRSSHDKDVIRVGYDEAHVLANIKKSNINHRIDMHLKKTGRKGIAVDRIFLKKTADLFGLVNVVFFSPEDLNLIKNSPSDRRKFIDMELCQLNKIYYSDLSYYNKALVQRNNLLKQISYSHSELDLLDVWDQQLVNYGIKVIKARDNFISMIDEIVRDIHAKLTSNKESLHISYEKNINEDEFIMTLKDKRDSDLRYQSTQVGPHRDDLIFMIGDMDVKKYGSQGQQRTVALSLKLAEIELVKKIIDDNPILLLDDVMSELDSKRRDSLLESIKGIQTVITCTGYDDFIRKRISIDKIFKVTQGSIREEVYE